MPRELVIGNGNLLINFDRRLVMRDLYYPYVGLLNHIVGQRNVMGVWVEGRFSWLDEGQWVRKLGYEKDTLVTKVMASNHQLGLEMVINDTVHFRENIYLKRVTIRNTQDYTREVKVFFTNDFNIDETDVGDTALYDPSLNAVYHYKRDKCFLINGLVMGKKFEGIHQYSTGRKRFAGAEGTWRDAEDGFLEGHPISQGSVDSTVSFRLNLVGRGEGTLYFWIIIGHGFHDTRQLNYQLQRRGPGTLMDETEIFWRQWVNKYEWDFADLSPHIQSFFKRSILIVRTQIDNRGGILAANDTDIMQTNRDHYSYVWPRDGALVAMALDRAGYPEITGQFFRFCQKAVTEGGFLWQKYHADASVGSSWHPWIKDGEVQLPIQEDESALVLVALENYYKYNRDLEFVESLYASLVKPIAEFLVQYRDERTGLPQESYDLWEERRGVFTWTAATVFSGLRAAARFASMFGDCRGADRYAETAQGIREAILKHLYSHDLHRFLRGIYLTRQGDFQPDYTLESSTAGIFMFDVLSARDPKVVGTMEAIEAGLWVKTKVGGVARYTNDYYFQKTGDIQTVPGNPWFITTLWLAQWHIAHAATHDELKRPVELFDWVINHALETGVLSEQLHPFTGEPLSVAPLTWSHSTFVAAVIDYVTRYRLLEGHEVVTGKHPVTAPI